MLFAKVDWNHTTSRASLPSRWSSWLLERLLDYQHMKYKWKFSGSFASLFEIANVVIPSLSSFLLHIVRNWAVRETRLSFASATSLSLTYGIGNQALTKNSTKITLPCICIKIYTHIHWTKLIQQQNSQWSIFIHFFIPLLIMNNIRFEHHLRIVVNTQIIELVW